MSDPIEFDTRETCEGCIWAATMPVAWFNVMLTGHYCYRDGGEPLLRGVSLNGDGYPPACCNRWEEDE